MYRAIVIAVMLLVGTMGPRGTTGVGATVWPADRATTHRHAGTAHAAPAVNTVLLASRVKRPTTTPTQAPLPLHTTTPLGSQLFPSNKGWNEPVAALPTATNSAQMISAISLTAGLHPDFGTYAGYGIPYNVVSGTQARVPVQFTYASESDP